MPALLVAQDNDKKRKRVNAEVSKVKSRKAAKLDKNDDIETKILQLQDNLAGDNDKPRDLSELIAIASDLNQASKTVVLAAVTLCRSFSKLIASEQLDKSNAGSRGQRQEAIDLGKLLDQFTALLRSWIGSPDAVKENAAVTLLMRIVKEEIQQDPERAEQAWRNRSTFIELIKSLLISGDAAGARQLFVEKYVEEFDDVRFYTFTALRHISKEIEVDASNALELLAYIEGVPGSQYQLEDWFGNTPAPKHTLVSLQAHRKAAQEAWLVVFRASLTHDHRKQILEMMHAQILPWFGNKLEVLTDFLTDSFNASGITAVLALDGIFYLITEKNIDYPAFYVKLYSLLDEDILHSKHRSSFLRLLEKCLASTHLPAALVASFVKRLARLALQAPPGAIVWLVPWTYNLLRQHPSCTYMIHRTQHPSHTIWATYPNADETGMGDVFDMTEEDPMLTKAIDSSLWELHTLVSHYHPNVATLASILREQFTKREYQLEDFLDHSYTTLLEGELWREVKKEPVVEWEIPKHIITAADGSGNLSASGSLLQAAIDLL